MGCNCQDPTENQSGNAQYWIPIKPGFPLSNACERAVNVGGIPAVTRFFNFTLINGGIRPVQQSNGGIKNMKAFFTPHPGCYGPNADYPSSCA